MISKENMEAAGSQYFPTTPPGLNPDPPTAPLPLLYREPLEILMQQ